MTDPKEGGWMGERATVVFCPETLHPSVPRRTGWGRAAGSPGWFSCTAIRAPKQEPAESQHQVQKQQIGSGGNKLNVPRTLVKAHGVPAACRATSRTSDPSSSRAGVQRGGEAELEMMSLPM